MLATITIKVPVGFRDLTIEKRIEIKRRSDGDLTAKVEWVSGKWADADEWFWDLPSMRDYKIMMREAETEVAA